MGAKYVSRGIATLNGTTQQHVKNIKMEETVYRNEVSLMDGSGSVEVAPKFKFSFDYVLPKTGARLDWGDVEDANVVIELPSGVRISYSGADCLSVGEMSLDGEAEATTTISFIAAERNIE